MSDNERERQISQRAHEIWEQEGRPEGRQHEHWEQARREIEGDTDDASSGARPDVNDPLSEVGATGGGSASVPQGSDAAEGERSTIERELGRKKPARPRSPGRSKSKV